MRRQRILITPPDASLNWRSPDSHLAMARWFKLSASICHRGISAVSWRPRHLLIARTLGLLSVKPVPGTASRDFFILGVHAKYSAAFCIRRRDDALAAPPAPEPATRPEPSPGSRPVRGQISRCDMTVAPRGVYIRTPTHLCAARHRRDGRRHQEFGSVRPHACAARRWIRSQRHVFADAAGERAASARADPRPANGPATRQVFGSAHGMLTSRPEHYGGKKDRAERTGEDPPEF